MTMQPGAIASEFLAWQVSIRPAGLDMYSAFWCSRDGRARRYVVAPEQYRATSPAARHQRGRRKEQQQPPSQARPRNRVA
jgi:hypothetical protein